MKPSVAVRRVVTEIRRARAPSANGMDAEARMVDRLIKDRVDSGSGLGRGFHLNNAAVKASLVRRGFMKPDPK